MWNILFVLFYFLCISIFLVICRGAVSYTLKGALGKLNSTAKRLITILYIEQEKKRYNVHIKLAFEMEFQLSLKFSKLH